MRSTLLLALLAVLALASVGCGGTPEDSVDVDPSLVGSWPAGVLPDEERSPAQDLLLVLLGLGGDTPTAEGPEVSVPGGERSGTSPDPIPAKEGDGNQSGSKP